ncbi:MAG: hypothetical protein HQ567_29240 [Candidatus Nealsonbacteria bacterium]|nr:hypothetical protein [Candidatus Nealsonbacteria bacterium]
MDHLRRARRLDSVEKLHAGPGSVSISVGAAKLTVNLGYVQVSNAELVAVLDDAVQRLTGQQWRRDAA